MKIRKPFFSSAKLNTINVTSSFRYEDIPRPISPRSYRSLRSVSPVRSSALTQLRELNRLLLEGDVGRIQQFLNQLPDGPFKQKLIISALDRIFQRDPANRNVSTIFTRVTPTENDVEIVQTLINNVPNLNVSVEDLSRTLAGALFLNMDDASHDRDYAYLEMLLEAGLDPRYALNEFLESRKDYDDIIKLIMNYMAGDAEKYRDQLTRLIYYIARENKVNLLQEVIRRGLYVEVPSILIEAIGNRASSDLIYLLLEAGVNRDDFRETLDYLNQRNSSEPWDQEVLDVFDTYTNGKRRLL